MARTALIRQTVLETPNRPVWVTVEGALLEFPSIQIASLALKKLTMQEILIQSSPNNSWLDWAQETCNVNDSEALLLFSEYASFETLLKTLAFLESGNRIIDFSDSIDLGTALINLYNSQNLAKFMAGIENEDLFNVEQQCPIVGITHFELLEIRASLTPDCVDLIEHGGSEDGSIELCLRLFENGKYKSSLATCKLEEVKTKCIEVIREWFYLDPRKNDVKAS